MNEFIISGFYGPEYVDNEESDDYLFAEDDDDYFEYGREEVGEYTEREWAPGEFIPPG